MSSTPQRNPLEVDIPILQEAYGPQAYLLGEHEGWLAKNMDITVTSRLRSWQHQLQLVRQGRTRVFPSQHNFGVAFDFVTSQHEPGSIRQYLLRYFRVIGLELIVEKDHYHAQAFPGTSWRFFQKAVWRYVDETHGLLGP